MVRYVFAIMWPGQVALKFSHLDFDPLIRAYFQGQITGHSSIAGEIDIHGPMKRPRNLVVSGNVTQLSADVENVKLQNDGPIHFGLENESLKVDEFHLTGTETDVSRRRVLCNSRASTCLTCVHADGST